jgi:predicted enzyme related to lactoylglutathione lyase
MTLKENYDGGLTCSVNVLDIQAAMSWYQEVLGFELLYYLEELGWAELKSPVPGVNVGLSQVEKMPPPGGNAVLTWGVKDIEQAKGKLENREVQFDGDIRIIEGMVKLATLYDPNGNCFMLYQDISLPKDG